MKAVLRGLCVLLCTSGAAAQAPAANADPDIVDLRFDPGTSVEAALSALNARGHRIVFSTALVTPGMTLRSAPRATRLGELLDEILAPWHLRAMHTVNGDWLVLRAPETGAAEPSPDPRGNGPEEPPRELQTIDVSASRYALATPGATVFLDRRGIEQMPHLADDAVRMLKVLPGVSGGDFSAALNIRGGRREETLLRIDGAEIHNAFHFRELDGALSVLDTNLVDSIDFITGGMPVRYGDHASGVVDMRTRRPAVDDDYRSAAGISFVSAYARTGGTFADGRGAWLASARRGYLDVIMKRVQADDEQITPRYVDAFGSFFRDIGENTTVSAHVLMGEDDLKLVSDDLDDIDSAGEGRAGHLWLTLDQRLGDHLRTNTVISTSTVRHWRDSAGEDDERTGDVDANFRFRFLDLRSDWTWSLGDRHLLLFGGNAGRTRADYDYSLVAALFDPTAPGGVVDRSHAHDIEVSGSKTGTYAAWRGRVMRDLVLEAGARWDRYRYPGQEFTTVSPRVNAVLGVGAHGELRAAWGVAHQPQGIDELQVEDDLTLFFRPERAHQAVLGYTHHFSDGWSGRVDVYRKDYSDLRPRFENALDPVQLIPEGAVDRVRIDATDAEAQGVEITVRREAASGVGGWASLALAQAREYVPGEGWSPRLWEQRKTVSAGVSWTGPKWSINLAGLFHQGTPTTRLHRGIVALPGGQDVDVVVTGERNGARLDHYARIDLRARRTMPLGPGRFSWYLEVTNLLDRDNPCCVESIDLVRNPRGGGWLEIKQTYWLPLIPSFGFQYEF